MLEHDQSGEILVVNSNSHDANRARRCGIVEHALDVLVDLHFIGRVSLASRRPLN